MSNYVYIAPTGDGWMNLARDGYFLDTVKRGMLSFITMSTPMP